ncbi:hypothetical protein V3C99_010907 [Haemonchus contortus]
MVYIYTLMLCLAVLSYEAKADRWDELWNGEQLEQKSDSYGLTEKLFIRRNVMKRPHIQKRFPVPPRQPREVRADPEPSESLGQPVSFWHHRPFWRPSRQAAPPEQPRPSEPNGPVPPPEPPTPPGPLEPSGPDQSPLPPESPAPFEPSEPPGPAESSGPPGPDEMSMSTPSTEIEEITTTTSPLLTTTTTTVETTTMETKETTTTSTAVADTTTTTEEEEEKPRKSTTLAPVAGGETEFDIFPTPFHLAVLGGAGALILFLLIFCCCCCRGGSGPTSTVRATKSQMGSRKKKKGKTKKVKKSSRSVRKPQPSQPSSSASASASGSTSQPRKAKKMEAEKINMMEFADKGVLVMQDVKGEVKHALDNEKSGEIVRVQYDTGQNELVTIGSEVEIIKTFSKVGSSSGDVKTSQSKTGAAKQKRKTGPQ